MAKKEYTKGNVVEVFGRVIGKGIEFSGSVLYLSIKIFAKATSSLFWVTGKHIDMVSTLKELKKPKYIAADYELVEENKKLLPEHDVKIIFEKFNLVELALNYARNSYEQKVLPLEEIIKINKQALIIASAIGNYLESSRDTTDIYMKKKGIKAARIYSRACLIYLKYYQTGNQKFKAGAEEILEKAVKYKQVLSNPEIQL